MKRLSSRKSLVLLAVIILNIVNALVGILGNVVSEDIKSILLQTGVSDYLVQITAVLLIAGLVLAAWVFKAEKYVEEKPLPEIVPESEMPEQEFLDHLSKRFEERILHKLDGRYEISLTVSDDLHGKNVRQFEEDFGSNGQVVDATRYIIDRFEEQGRLMILGSPGSGKTVLLLTLARYLVGKAKQDVNKPLPVVLNLASWSPDHKRFDDWVIAMLTKGYGLSAEFAETLLVNRRITLLLDGLDELARNEETKSSVELRSLCLGGLDRFLHDGTMNVVICCRLKQFNEIIRQTNIEPPVAALVVVQDLTLSQIDRALIRASQTPKDRFAATHLVSALGLDRNDVYQKVLSIPFYFTTALQVFDSTKSPRLDAFDEETLKNNLVKAFVAKKLEVTQNIGGFSRRQTILWLKWLATFLHNTRSVTFELADLQPSALKKPWHYRLVFCLIFALLGTLIFTILNQGRLRGAPFYFVALVLIAPFVAIEDLSQTALSPLRRWRTWRTIIVQLLVVEGLISVVLTVRFLLTPTTTIKLWTYLIAQSIVMVILMPVIVGGIIVFRTSVRLVVGAFGSVENSHISTEDFVQWTIKPLTRLLTWRKILARVIASSISGAIAVATFGAVLWPLVMASVYNDEEYKGFFLKLREGFVILEILTITAGLLLGAAGGIIIGFYLGLIKACRRTARLAGIHSPYQRIRSGTIFSVLQSGVIAALLIWPVPVVMWFFRGTPVTPLRNSLLSSILAFLFFGICGFFRTPLFKHSVLRICLTLQRSMPLRYSRFLTYATDLNILEREGGQWRFRHQILQDHFCNRLE